MILYGVEKPDASYVLPMQGEVENWFILTSVKIFQFLHGTGCIIRHPVPCRKENLIAREYNDLLETKEGYFSLEDKVGELVQNPEGLQIFREFMAVYDSRKKGAAAASHMTEEQRLMTMKSMRLKELMRRTNTPGEEVKQWAERLQSIEK